MAQDPEMQAIRSVEKALSKLGSYDKQVEVLKFVARRIGDKERAAVAKQAEELGRVGALRPVPQAQETAPAIPGVN